MQLQAINEGFEISTRVLDTNCDTTVSALIHGSRDLTDQYLAVRWQPIVAKATLMARQAADYIDILQNELKDTHVITDEHIKTLFDRLIHYKQSLPGLFRILQSQSDFKYVEQSLPELYKSLAILPHYPVYAMSGSNYSVWKDSTFDGDEALTRLALTKLKHDLILSAYQIIQFTRNEIAEFGEAFTKFDAIAALSANVVKPGDSIQVTSGIGSFRTELEPIITIGDKRVAQCDNAVAIRTIKAPPKPGKYSIPVRIEYTKPDGSKAWRDFTLNYQVVAPCAP
jgi:hypothetical protein